MSCCMTQRAPQLSHGGNTFTQITQQRGTTGFILQPAACQRDDVWQGHRQCLAEHSTLPALTEAKAEVLPAESWRLLEQTGRAPGLGRRGRLQELWAWETQVLHPCGSKSKPAPEKCSPSTPQPVSIHSKTGFPSVFLHYFWANCNIPAWSLCKEKNNSSRQSKALLISEGKEASPHPCSPPSVTDPHPLFNIWELLVLN